MDGSVSTLAPVFAAAFVTHTSKDAFLVGMVASVGAGISMVFADVMSDDGVLSGHGRPWAHVTVCGLMTILGGIGHTLPLLISNFYSAMIVAGAIVAVELAMIAWTRHRYMDRPLLSAAFQVIVGGVLVFIVGQEAADEVVKRSDEASTWRPGTRSTLNNRIVSVTGVCGCPAPSPSWRSTWD
jgi:erythrin-vacuolar iron transport family protein